MGESTPFNGIQDGSVSKSLAVRRRHAAALKEAEKNGYNKALALFTPSVMKQHDSEMELLTELQAQLRTAHACHDTDTVKSLEITIKRLTKVRSELMARAHGTPVQKQQIESHNTNVNVTVVHITDLLNQAPDPVASESEVIDAEVVDGTD